MAQEAGFQKYDPTAASPYTPVQMPEPTPATPSPLPTQGPQVNGAVKTSGAVATVADGILRGFMAGRSMAQAKKVMQLKSKSDGLQASYNQDAQRLYQMTRAGVDQNSPEYKQAYSAVQGSWGALMDFYGQHIEQDKGKKKSGNKFKQAGQDILGALHSSDPMEQSRAWYQVAQKAGPPVLSQIAMINTPQAKAVRTAETNAANNAVTGTQAAGVGAQGQLEEAKQALRYSQITGKPEKDWTEDEKNFIQQYDSLHGKASDQLVRERAQLGQQIIDNPNLELTPSQQMLLTGKNPAGSAPKVGSFGDFMLQGYGAHPTAEQYEQGRKLWSQASASTTVGEHVVMVPQLDGSVKAITVETTTHKVFPGAPAPTAAPNAQGGASQPQGGSWIGSPKLPALYVVGGNASKISGMQSPGNVNIAHRPEVDGESIRPLPIKTDKGTVLIPTISDGSDGKRPHVMTRDEAVAAYRQTGKNLGIFDTLEHAGAYARQLHEQQAGLGKMTRRGSTPAPPPAHAAKPAARASSPAPHGAGVVAVGPTVGGRETAAGSAAHKKYDDAVELASFADRVKKSDNPSEQREFALNLARTMAGRFQMQEFDQAINHAGIANSFQQWLNDKKTGALTPTIVDRMVQIAHDYKDSAYDEWKAAGGEVAEGGQPDKFAVTDPTGKTHYFDTQAQADHFKQLAGIK